MLKKLIYFIFTDVLLKQNAPAVIFYGHFFKQGIQ